MKIRAIWYEADLAYTLAIRVRGRALSSISVCLDHPTDDWDVVGSRRASADLRQLQTPPSNQGPGRICDQRKRT